MRTLFWLRRILLHEGKTLIDRDRALRRMLRKRPFIYAILGGTGVILFWRGIWEIADRLPVISNPLVSIFVGLAILAATGPLVLQLIGQAALEERIDDLQQAEKHLEAEEHELAQEEKALAQTESQLAEAIQQEIQRERDLQRTPPASRT